MRKYLTPQHDLRVTRRAAEQAPDVLVLGVSGDMDACAAVSLHEVVLAAMRPRLRGVVLDLAEVPFVSAASVRVLGDIAATLAETGRGLSIARCRPVVREIVRQVGLPLELTGLHTVSGALAAVRAATAAAKQPTDAGRGIALLRERARNLPGALRTRPLIAGAVSELRDRYDMPDPKLGFALLRDSSQQYNLKVRALALAFVAAPPATPDQPTWFPGRRRDLAPPVPFTGAPRGWRGNHGGFLSAVLDANMSIMDSRAGYLQLADHFVGGLRLESQQGLPREFTHAFTYADEAPAASLVAFDSGKQATRRLDEEPDPDTRKMFRAGGFRSVHSVALVDDKNQALGVVSTLHEIPAPRTTREQTSALREVARQSAGWLDWYQRTIVLDALEHLHQTARRARAERR